MRTEVRRREVELSAEVVTKRAARGSAGGTSRPLDAVGVGLILLSTLLWASQAIGIKFGLTGFTPLTLLAVRAVLATLVLLGIALALRLPFPKGHVPWIGAIVLGILQVALSGSMFFWALQHIPVGRATIFTSIQPFLTVIAAHFLISGERLTVWRIIGLVLGFGGVLVLVLSRGGDLSSTSALADVTVLGAAAIWSAGSLLVKRIGHRWHTMSLVTVQMASAAVVMVVVARIFEPGAAISFTPESVGGLAYLVTFGSVGAFFMGYHVIQRHQVSIVSSFMFLQPVLAVVLGVVLLGEQVTWVIMLSLSLIALGLTFVNRGPSAKSKPAPLSVGKIPCPREGDADC